MALRSAALALCPVALALASCGGGTLERKEFSSIEAALKQSGLEICETATADEPEEADSQKVLDVAEACGDEDDEATVVVTSWPDRAARDAALRRFDVQSRPSSQNHGNTWAYGQFTIHVSGARNEDAVDHVIDAMRELGAS